MSHLMFIAPSAYVLGGVQVWLDYLVKGLAGIGYNVTIGLVGGQHHDVDKYLAVHPFTNVERIENPTGSPEGRVRSIEQCVRKIAPDMVLSVNIADVYPALARLKQAGQCIKTVMTLHGIQADFLEDAKRYCNVLDGVVCTNRLVESMLWASGVAEHRVQYAPYGVDYDPLVMVQKNSTSYPIRIAYVGRFDQAQKRVLDIPAILKKLTVPYELRLAGDGPLENQLRTAMAELTEHGNSMFLGVLSPSEVALKIYQWADVLLVTSSWETGPLVIWEAMSHGVPVVTSAYVGSVAEGSLDHEHNCQIFPVGDVSGAAERIMSLKDSALRTKIITNGIKLIAEKYSKEASVTAWALAIENVLKLPSLLPESIPKPEPNGRLDRVLGVGLAESIRRLVRRSYVHRSAGSEWPHSHSSAITNDLFLLQAANAESKSVD